LKDTGLKKLFMRFVAYTACLFVLSGCATVQVNSEIDQTEDLFEHMSGVINSPSRSDELLVVLTFSGGGTRAAAMSYGVLEALSKVKIPDRQSKNSAIVNNRSLLNEVDIISSVSGGSFTSAYYGLHGDRIFEDYKDSFLYRNVQSELLWKLFWPGTWPKFLAKGYGRSSLAADHYDKILFKGAKFKDINPQRGPVILIQSTDMVDSYIFTFSPYFFNLICSDLEKFPLSYAVAASSSFPGAFDGITLRNYAGQCGYKEHPYMLETLKTRDTTNNSYLFAEREAAYLDGQTKQYLHLYDGGVSDNLGLAGPSILMLSLREKGFALKDIGLGNTRKIVFIIVNSQVSNSNRFDLLNIKQDTPTTKQSISASISTMMNNANFEKLYIFNRNIKEILELSKPGKTAQQMNFYTIHLSFDNIADDQDRQFFENVPTTLSLKDETVDRVIEVAGRLLFESKEFQRLIEDLDGQIPVAK
jgi:NTE family protein